MEPYVSGWKKNIPKSVDMSSSSLLLGPSQGINFDEMSEESSDDEPVRSNENHDSNSPLHYNQPETHETSYTIKSSMVKSEAVPDQPAVGGESLDSERRGGKGGYASESSGGSGDEECRKCNKMFSSLDSLLKHTHRRHSKARKKPV